MVIPADDKQREEVMQFHVIYRAHVLSPSLSLFLSLTLSLLKQSIKRSCNGQGRRGTGGRVPPLIYSKPQCLCIREQD